MRLKMSSVKWPFCPTLNMLIISRITLPSRSRQRRETLQDMARPLKRWLYSHKHNPYPTKDDKIRLAHVSSMTLTQVSNWFANARRRLKNTVREPGMTWEDRIRCYNDHVVGKAELLSVSSMGSDFESEMGEELTGKNSTSAQRDDCSLSGRSTIKMSFHRP